MSSFRTPELSRDQAVMFPHRLDEVVPENHPVRFLDQILRSESFRDLFTEWESEYSIGARGHPPYHPRDLAALSLYGLMIGSSSSRKLEESCKVRVDVMWLMSCQRPDHATIAKFIKNNPKRLEKVFKSSIEVGVRIGIVTLNHVSVDGTKLGASASKESMKNEKEIERLIAKEVEARLAEFAKNDAAEAGLLSHEDVCLSEREARLRAALEIIERRRKEASGNNKVAGVACITDPDARQMKGKQGGSGPNYNCQTTVDADSGMIVGAEVTDDPSDSGQLAPQIDQVEENCGTLPQEVSADSAYNTGPDLKHCAVNGVETFLPDSGQREAGLPENAQKALDKLKAGDELNEEEIEALPRGRNGKLGQACFEFDEANDRYVCPQGKALERSRQSTDHQKCGVSVRVQYLAAAQACSDCPLRTACCMSERRGRIVTRDQYEPERVALRARMATESGREAYRKRGPVAETPFAVVKNILGIRKFTRRGARAVKTQWLMICTALNMRQLIGAFAASAV